MPKIYRTEHGFKWGAADVRCYFDDDKKGWVTVGVRTPKADIQIYVTKTGKVRVFDMHGEWTPPKKG